jgi:hypothetical protein
MTRESKLIRETSIRKEAGVKIDPETADVFWEHGSVRDPYYLFEHGDDWGEDNIGRNYFARAPGSDVWVEFGDLPDAVRHRLWERIEAGDLGPDLLDRFFKMIAAGD